MTGLEIFLLFLTFGGTGLAVYLNKDSRKKYICKVVFGIQLVATAMFLIIKDDSYLYPTVAAIELTAIILMLRSFRLPIWQNEGYLLMVCFLLIVSAWNTIFYTYSQHFVLYADVADYLAVVTVAWMIGRSDNVVDYLSDFTGINSGVRVH